MTFRDIGPRLPDSLAADDVFKDNEPERPAAVHDPTRPSSLAGRRQVQVQGLKRVETSSSTAEEGPPSATIRNIVQECLPLWDQEEKERLIVRVDGLRREEAKQAYEAFLQYKERSEEVQREQRSKYESEIETLQHGGGNKGGDGAGREGGLVDPDAVALKEMMGMGNAEENHFLEGQQFTESPTDDLEAVKTAKLALPGQWPVHTPALSGKVAHTNTRLLAIEIRIKARLLPAIVLLSRHASLSDSELTDARRYAWSALDLAQRKTDEAHRTESLQARCAYYVGLADFLSQARSDADASPGAQCLEHFQHATAARGVHPEGGWACEWIEYVEKRTNRSEPTLALEKRPESRASVLGRALSWFSPFGRTKSTFGERIPSFQSWHTGDGDSRPVTRDGAGTRPTTRDGAGSVLGEIQERAQEAREEAESLDAAILDSAEHEEATTRTSVPDEASERKEIIVKLPRPSRRDRPPLHATMSDPTILRPLALVDTDSGLLSPVTTPSPRSSMRRLSLAYTATSPNERKGHRRKTSLLASLTSLAGRERRPSELEQAEEGHSPFKATFEALPETSPVTATFAEGFADGELWRRKRSEPGDMV